MRKVAEVMALLSELRTQGLLTATGGRGAEGRGRGADTQTALQPARDSGVEEKGGD